MKSVKIPKNIADKNSRFDEALVLGSAKSTRVSLAGVRIGRYELSEHRANLLLRVPEPGEDEPEPSLEDRAVLREIGQYSSIVISARTGRTTEFTSDPFE